MALFEHDAGTITNQIHGTIADSLGIAVTVTATDGPPGFSTYVNAAVTNHGTIAGLYGVEFLGLGGVTNTGLIRGARDGIVIGPTDNTIDNSGLISATGSFFSANGTAYMAAAISIAATGAITNATAGTVAATLANGIVLHGGTVANQGAIIAGGRGVEAYGAGYVRNGGAITANTDILFTGGRGTVDNTGQLDSTRFFGVELLAGGLVTNSGTIAGWVSAAGVAEISNTGLITGAVAGGLNGLIDITNASTGIIGQKGQFGGVEIDNGYIENAGLITGNGADLGGFQNPYTVILNNTGTIWAKDPGAGQNTGVYSRATAVITNAGTINGAAEGIEVQGFLSLTNSGTVAGGTYAILAQGGGAITDSGLINGAIGLATSAGATGLLSLSPGAAWLASGILDNQVTLANDGAITINGHRTLDLEATLSGAGTIDLGAGYLTIGGPVSAAQTLDFTGHGTLNLTRPLDFAAPIENFALKDTIALAGIALSSIIATHFVAGVLTLSEASSSLQFTFSNPSAFAGETFALAATTAGIAITLAPAAAVIPALAPFPTFA